ncbi:hypothetical protein B6I21_08965 [candidate division KSB1 bacterium 4572_119]|nr:MAG: hypothetical protein B6I21_08965 [candidate division KSB1 bacterium 4572_119]
MDKRMMNIVWGSLIVLVGVLLLLITTDVIEIEINTAWVFGGLFFFGFLIFLGLYFSMHRKQFWPLIPGITFLGLCLLILSDEIGIRDHIGAGFFILFIGLSFLAVFLLHKEHWWAIIPAGTVASVSMVIFFGDMVGVGAMFLGMGLTFLALYYVLLNRPEEKHWWPLIPGGILGFMGLVFLFFDEVQFGKYIMPIALIIIGTIFIIKHLKETG